MSLALAGVTEQSLWFCPLRPVSLQLILVPRVSKDREMRAIKPCRLSSRHTGRGSEHDSRQDELLRLGRGRILRISKCIALFRQSSYLSGGNSGRELHPVTNPG